LVDRKIPNQRQQIVTTSRMSVNTSMSNDPLLISVRTAAPMPSSYLRDGALVCL